MERPVFPANILVVKARFRGRIQEVAINLRGDIEIAIDRAANKFDFQSMQPLAVTDGSEGAGLNRYALDMGNNTRRIRRFWRIACNRRCEEEAREQRNGGTPHGRRLHGYKRGSKGTRKG